MRARQEARAPPTGVYYIVHEQEEAQYNDVLRRLKLY